MKGKHPIAMIFGQYLSILLARASSSAAELNGSGNILAKSEVSISTSEYKGPCPSISAFRYRGMTGDEKDRR